MQITITNLSSLEKRYRDHDPQLPMEENPLLCPGEVYHFMQKVQCPVPAVLSLQLSGDLAPYVRSFEVKDILADYPVFPDRYDEHYLFTDPQAVSDELVPLSSQKDVFLAHPQGALIWFDVTLPKDFSGEPSVTIRYTPVTFDPSLPPEEDADVTVSFTTLSAALPDQKLLFTQWFHVDCIAQIHQVEIYSEPHWELIRAYMKCAADHGMNMILTPVTTPPLDTRIGSYRPNIQLMKLYLDKASGTYRFDWSNLKRYLELAREVGISHFEIAHLFSQWGLKYSPAIYAFVNGSSEPERIFGWDHPSSDPDYLDYLTQYLPALTEFLKEEGLLESCFFHLSDEPSEAMLPQYRKFYEFVHPLLGDVRMMDALSSLRFYQEGLVETPVTAIDHIQPFLEQDIPHQWAYYCCGQCVNTSNRFLAQSSSRNRILGLTLYLYQIEGFLQWGYNYYNSRVSVYPINPYLTTSGDMSYPSGDPFSVYPGKNGPNPSLRQKVFLEGLQDLRLCQLAEEKLGRETVVRLIQDMAIEECGSIITFNQFPHTPDFPARVNRRLKELLV